MQRSSVVLGEVPASRKKRARQHGLICRLVFAFLIAMAMPVTANAHLPIIYAVAKAFGFVAGNAKLIDVQARRAYRRALRPGTCAERDERIAKILPDSLRLARYARDIYDHDDEREQAAVETKAVDEGQKVYFEAARHRYAEVHTDAVRNEVVVVFKGTRLSVSSDISADLLSVTGIETAYYKWAFSLVAQVAHEHPGMQVIVTGHSLGGGLALYAVLRNPGVRGVAFNPVGLSWLTWLSASRAERARTNAALTVVSTRNPDHIEPVTAITLARRSVLPGELLFVESDASGPLALHRAAAVVASLEHIVADEGGGSHCEGFLGVVAH